MTERLPELGRPVLTAADRLEELMGPTLAGAILAALREEIAATADKAPSSTGGYISVADAASVLGVSSRQIYRQVKSGALPSRRVGERIVIPRDALR